MEGLDVVAILILEFRVLAFKRDVLLPPRETFNLFEVTEALDEADGILVDMESSKLRQVGDVNGE